MAGKNDHYDPRFLLKGFESRRKGNTIFAWYFHKGLSPREDSIRNIGHANLFYGSRAFDAYISKKEETEYSVVVDRVRKDKKIHSIDKNSLVEFVYFQAARTRAARESYRTSLVSAAKDARQRYGTAEKMEEFILEILHPDDKETRKEIERKFKEKMKKQHKQLSYLQLQVTIRNELRKYRQEKLQTEALFMASITDTVLLNFLNQSPAFIKEYHNKALEVWLKKQPGNPGSGLEAYLKLRWSVEQVDDFSLILSDATVLHRNPDSPALDAGLGGSSLILLPLSHNLLLIGENDDAIALPSVDDINRSSAELSLYFFVSSRCSVQEEDYHRLISKRFPTSEEDNCVGS